VTGDETNVVRASRGNKARCVGHERYVTRRLSFNIYPPFHDQAFLYKSASVISHTPILASTDRFFIIVLVSCYVWLSTHIHTTETTKENTLSKHHRSRPCPATSNEASSTNQKRRTIITPPSRR